MIRSGLVFLASLAFAPLAAPTPAEVPLTPCTVAGVQARCGRLVVPENRTLEAGRKISLRIAVVPARSEPVSHAKDLRPARAGARIVEAPLSMW